MYVRFYLRFHILDFHIEISIYFGALTKVGKALQRTIDISLPTIVSLI